MRVYASTACLDGGRSLWELLDDYAAAGLEAVELGACRLDPNDALVERLAERRFAYAVHNYFPPPAEPFVLNLASADRELAARSAAFVGSALELASRLGAPFYAVHGGFAVDPLDGGPAGLRFPDAPSCEAALEAAHRFEERLTPLEARAKELGVELLVENNVCTTANRGKLLHQTTDELGELIGAVPGVGLLVDTGHLNVTASTFGFDREAFVRTLAPHIGAFHVHDNDGVVDRHDPVDADSWLLPLLRSVGAPCVVEARLSDAGALARHVRGLEEQLQ